MQKKNKRIFVTGHNGLVGSAVIRRLKQKGYSNILTINKKKLDLRDQKKVFKFFEDQNIDSVINAAGKVGGIYANNKYKAEFIYDNLAIQNNIIHSSFQNKVKSLIFLGSICIYPKKSKIPIKENDLLTGELEKTNEPYAISKIAGVKMCESYNFQYKTNYKCLMPCNIYGPNDNYNSKTSHFFPALIKKILNAKKNKKKSITIWGTGLAKREMMYVDDLADACIYFLNKKTKESLINVGTENDMAVIDYAKYILKELKLNCKIKLDKSKPTGTIRKLLDCRIAKKYGWTAKISLQEGLRKTLADIQR